MTTIPDFRAEPAIRFKAAPDRAVPRDTERRFEDALERKGGRDQPEGKARPASEERVGDATTLLAAGDVPAFAVQALAGWGGSGGQGGQQHPQDSADAATPDAAIVGVTTAPAPAIAAPVAATPAPQGEVVNQAAYATMADRIALPQGVTASETFLTMPDPRWLAREAVIVRDADGALSVDVGTDGKGDADADGQRLRERLEARGLVVSSVTTRAVG